MATVTVTPPPAAPAAPAAAPAQNILARVLSWIWAQLTALWGKITSIPYLGRPLAMVGTVVDKLTAWTGLQTIAKALHISVQNLEVMVVAGLIAFGCYVWGSETQRATVDQLDASVEQCQKALKARPAAPACPRVTQLVLPSTLPVVPAPAAAPVMVQPLIASPPAVAAQPAASAAAPVAVAHHRKRASTVVWYDPMTWRWPALSFEAASAK